MGVVDVNRQLYIVIDGVSIPRSLLEYLPDLTRFEKWKEFSWTINSFTIQNPAEIPMFISGFSANEKDEVIETLRELAEIKRRFRHLFAQRPGDSPR